MAPATPPPFQSSVGGVKFQLQSVRYEGATVYSDRTLQRYVKPFLGQSVSLGDLQVVAEVITARYRRDGYVLSRAYVPEQDVSGGAVTIKIVEGYIEKVQVEGLPSGHRRLIERIAAHITASRPLRLKVLERAVLTINDLPGVAVKTLIAPSATTPGAADLTLVASERRFGGQVEADNRGSAAIGPVQGFAEVHVNGLLGGANQTSLKVAATPSNELRYVALSERWLLNTSGTQISVEASEGETRPGATLDPFQIAGHTDGLDLTLTQPFIRSRRYDLSGRAQFDVSDSKSNTGATQLYDDRMHIVRLGLHGDFVDSVVFSSLGSTSYDFAVSQGLKGAGVSPIGSLLVSRFGGRSDFSKMTFDVVRSQILPQGNSLSLHLQGQLAGSVLLSSEQFTLGGSAIGRGFEPSELAGDHGLGGTLEVAHNMAEPAPFTLMQVYAFTDAGEIWAYHLQPGLTRSAKLASAGIGARLALPSGTYINAEVATPLEKPIPSQDFSPGIFLTLSRSF